MGGSCSSRKSSYRVEDAEWEPRRVRKVRPSDEDRKRWVGEPDVDRKASDFIAKFHETRFTDPECQTIMV